MSLDKLLLHEEAAQMMKLPGTSGTESNNLEKSPLDGVGIGRFGLISKAGLALTHQVLLLLDVLHLGVNVSDTLSQSGEFFGVRRINVGTSSTSNVQNDLDL